jgi:SAM-dependent methyltransferase
VGNRELLEAEDWDRRWHRLKIPTEVKRDTAQFGTKDLIAIFDRVLPQKGGIDILEIGAAPGRWLAYFKKNFHYNIHAIDYSSTGCQKMQENFDSLHLESTIYRMDILTSSLSEIPRFDIVYSFGFIEHFSDFSPVVAKHVELVKKGGLLIIGVPNFAGFTQTILRKTAPRIYTTHNTDAMNIENWKFFEEQYQLAPLFTGYLGGLNLVHCKRCENRTVVNRTIRFFFKTLTRITEHMDFLRKFNSKHWSPYLLGIYRKE